MEIIGIHWVFNPIMGGTFVIIISARIFYNAFKSVKPFLMKLVWYNRQEVGVVDADGLVLWHQDFSSHNAD